MGANLPFWNRVLPPLIALQLKMLYQKFGTKAASNKLSKFSLVDMFWLDGNFPWLICCVWRSRFLIIFCSPVLKHELGGELQIGQLFTKHCSDTFLLVDEFVTFLRHFFSFQSEQHLNLTLADWKLDIFSVSGLCLLRQVFQYLVSAPLSKRTSKLTVAPKNNKMAKFGTKIHLLFICSCSYFLPYTIWDRIPNF